MSELSYLKMPPHSVEAEQAVIAAVVLNNRLIHELDMVRESDFHRPSHIVIWRRIQALAVQSIPIDPVVLVGALEGAGELEIAGGYEYIVDLVSNGRGDANVQHYAAMIRDRAISRKLIQIGYEIAQIGYDNGEAQEKIDKVQSLTMQMEAKNSAEPKHINDILRRTIENLDRRFHHKGEIIGLETGFTDLDKATCGLSPGDFVIVAGRPSMGKTTFAMNIADHCAVNGKFVIAFNLEMSDESLMLRSFSSLGGVHHEKLRSGKLEDHEFTAVTAAASKVKDKSIYVDDDGSVTSAQVLSRVRKIANKAGRSPDLIVIDYIQLLADEGDGTQRITQISRRLKLVATAMKCPLIALSQLNRGVEGRPLDSRRPLMSDLRESGAIEQDADIIIMMYRDEVYNENTTQKGVAEAIIRKQRNGPLKTIYLASQLEYSRFKTLLNYTPQQPTYEPKRRGRGYDD